MTKPYSPSCERNQEPILQVLKKVLGDSYKNILELGSGTGQHAAYIAKELPHISWTCTDLRNNHPGIQLWINEAALENGVNNLKGPIEWEIGKNKFPEGNFDVVFTANTFHIMSWDKVKTFIDSCGANLATNSLVIIYGPFNYSGSYTSKSNADFDLWLKDRDPQSAIRDFEAVNESFKENGFKLIHDIEMPANNRILVFNKN